MRRSDIVGDSEKYTDEDIILPIIYIAYHPNSHKVPSEKEMIKIMEDYGEVKAINFNNF